MNRVAVLLMAYNQVGYIERAIESILAQDYPEFTLWFSDDCSNDGTFDAVQKLIMGGAIRKGIELKMLKSTQNEGVVGHFNKMIRLIDSEIIVYQAGDDIARSDRVTILLKTLADCKEASFVESRYSKFSESSPLDRESGKIEVKYSVNNEIEKISWKEYKSGRCEHLSSSTRAFKRDILVKYPDLCRSLPSEDSPSALRLFFDGYCARSNQSLLYKRIHSENATSNARLKLMNYFEFQKQYESDAKFAFDNNIIDSEFQRQALEWAERITEKRNIWQEYENGFHSFQCLLTKVIPAKSLSFKDKVKAIRGFLRIDSA